MLSENGPIVNCLIENSSFWLTENIPYEHVQSDPCGFFYVAIISGKHLKIFSLMVKRGQEGTWDEEDEPVLASTESG